MPLNRDQLVEALGLVDEMIDCNAQLHGPVEGPRREALESSMAARQAKIRSYLDASEVFVAPMERSDRLALETELINRALQHDVVLYGTVTTSSNLIFGWRSPRGQMGPQFDEREQAIDWIAEWLAQDVDWQARASPRTASAKSLTQRAHTGEHEATDDDDDHDPTQDRDHAAGGFVRLLGGAQAALHMIQNYLDALDGSLELLDPLADVGHNCLLSQVRAWW